MSENTGGPSLPNSGFVKETVLKMDAGRVKGDKEMMMDVSRVRGDKIMKMDAGRVEGDKKMTMDASRVEGGSGKVSFSNISRIKHHCLQIMKDNGVVAESGGKVA
ncbi:hypothetical protein OS493_003907 [Desmophyllum pertusum]|uniref:Uncharacterized protein n=1 Tax=Desmophyllum pertusum TaxID=174260 RepID=A0A9W9ZVW2_9CNID|nr:hypothetical protein OS493_003907 [Desmophyllum pertusum]